MAKARKTRGGNGDSANGAKKILAIDIGGSKVKILVSGEHEPRKAPSGKKFTPTQMVDAVKELAKGWQYDAISIGYPGVLGAHGPRNEPQNLGPGWVGFNFAAAFDRPVRIINDAAMQALGSYEDGRMLFLGFGTGLGAALIAERVIVPLELGRLPYNDKKTLEGVVSQRALDELGKTVWREVVTNVVEALAAAFVTDYVVLGGGNAKLLKKLPAGARLGNNLNAFRGGFRLWSLEDLPTLAADTHTLTPTQKPGEWRVI